MSVFFVLFLHFLGQSDLIRSVFKFIWGVCFIIYSGHWRNCNFKQLLKIKWRRHFCRIYRVNSNVSFSQTAVGLFYGFFFHLAEAHKATLCHITSFSGAKNISERKKNAHCAAFQQLFVPNHQLLFLCSLFSTVKGSRRGFPALYQVISFWCCCCSTKPRLKNKSVIFQNNRLSEILILSLADWSVCGQSGDFLKEVS